MVYSLTYRRPPHVHSARASVLGDEKTQSIGEASIDSQGTGMSFGIPDALSFDRIMSGGTCPVSTNHPTSTSMSRASTQHLQNSINRMYGNTSKLFAIIA